MSTGAAHYDRAEKLLHTAWQADQNESYDEARLVYAEAQVHATLALAAATALAAFRGSEEGEHDVRLWLKVTAPDPPKPAPAGPLVGAPYTAVPTR